MRLAIEVYKLVWVRCALLVLIPMVTLFLAQTETWSGTTWDEASDFAKYRLGLMCLLAGASPLAAFIDQSLKRANDEMDRRRGDTEFIAKLSDKVKD